jgi:GNAT superfamily N-acetyltransferase
MTETSTRQAAARWPKSLQPGALRWARSSGHYEQTVRFYRDLVGLPVVGSFTASFGADGTIFGLPDDGLQMEIVRAAERTGPPDPHDQLVFYLTGDDAVRRATRALSDDGLEPDPSLHDYWRANGATMYADPDGRGVVYAPWVYGVDPDPVDRSTSSTTTGAGTRIELFTGDRANLRPLFELAEDSPSVLDSYLESGRILVALVGDDVVGHLQLVDTDSPGALELKNMAIRESLQGRGLGRRLVQAAIELVTAEERSTLRLATAAADVGNVRFYQRLGFRMRSIERDAFTPATGYPADIAIDGIALCDRVWMDYQVRS